MPWSVLRDKRYLRIDVRTVKHLVEKHNADIHKRSQEGRTALDLAEERKGRTECADYLRALQSTRPHPSWSRSRVLFRPFVRRLSSITRVRLSCPCR